MKTLAAFLGLVLCISPIFSDLNAQAVDVSKVPTPTDGVLKAFNHSYANVENPQWYHFTTNNGNEFYFATFTRDGDQKRLYYKNGTYISLMTVVPEIYCPRKIKQVTATLHPDFKIAEVVYLQSIYNNFYRVLLTKGKKKKMECLTMIFSANGELLSNENDPILEIIKEFDVTAPATK